MLPHTQLQLLPSQCVVNGRVCTVIGMRCLSTSKNSVPLQQTSHLSTVLSLDMQAELFWLVHLFPGDAR